MLKVKGKIKEGYGVASGKSQNNPYPEGTIKMQLSYFKKLGLDLSNYFFGTLNVNIKPLNFKLIKADYYFPQVNWYKDLKEDFSFVEIELVYQNKNYQGFLYYPHPETKPAHFQDASIMELIFPKIKDINYGDEVIVLINKDKILIQSKGQR